MKKLVLTTLMAGSVALTGCVESSDVSPCDDEELNGGACLEIVVECPPDATGFLVDGLAFEEDDSCASGGIAVLVDPGTYDLEITPIASDIDFVADFATVTLGDLDVVTAFLDE